jgi:AcrR family transcriptional regulator
MCNHGWMPTSSARARSVDDTRRRILDVAREVLGQNPDAGMGDIAAAAGVVRRTVYGHFPNRSDLVRTLAGQAVTEIVAVLDEVDAAAGAPDEVWVEFVARLWPLTRRYRVLLALRRGEQGPEIHALLAPVDRILADLVRRGQDDAVFGRHLPAEILSQIAYTAVFSIADHHLATGSLDAGAATVTSLLVLGVPEPRARVLAGGPP